MTIDLSNYDESDLAQDEDATVSRDTTTHEVRTDENKLIVFEVRDLPYRKKTQFVTQNFDPEGDIPVNLDGYYADVLGYRIVDSTLDMAIPQFLASCTAHVGAQLETLVPPPVDDVPEEEQKKYET